MIQKRLAAIESLMLGEARQVVIHCIYEGDDEPAEAEKEAAIEAYIQTFGDQPVIVIYWQDGIFEGWAAGNV